MPVLKRMTDTVGPADSSNASADSFREGYIENDTTNFFPEKMTTQFTQCTAINTNLKVSLAQYIKIFDYMFNFSALLAKSHLLHPFISWKGNNLRVQRKVPKSPKKAVQTSCH